MELEKYRQKRDFERTAEPEGKVEPSPGGRLYVIHKHAARRLHYDLRLELDGVLKSWAVPRGPSLDPAERRLAVHVEDHPIEYGSFEGTIPRGEYGGGTVMLWDRGRWEPETDPREGYDKGDFKFRLYGQKLKGSWVLARMKGKAGEDGKNWLLIKKRDSEAKPPSGSEPADLGDRSVATGREMDEIAAEAQTAPHAHHEAGKTAKAPRSKSSRPKEPSPGSAVAQIDPSGLPGAAPAPMPGTFHPELATPAKKPPAGEDWLHEIKYDGYRLLCFLSDGRARLLSRNGKDWTSQFGEIARSAQRLPVESAILDGEAVVLDREGRTDFQALQNILSGIRGGRLLYYAFDIPYCQGFDLTRAPLTERKKLLRRLLERLSGKGPQILFGDHMEGGGDSVFHHACRLQLEGIISKKADSPYEQKRSRRWVKVKCGHRQEFVIGGYTEPSGSRKGFGALLLGRYDRSGDLVYSGKVGTGFSDRSLQDMAKRLRALEAAGAPFANPPAGREARGVHWVEPKLVCEVKFGSWTEEGILRHASFEGMREDKSPKEVAREDFEPRDSGKRGAEPARPSGRAARESETSAMDFALSTPGRVFYPEIGVTKRDLARYYADVSEWMLPHLVHRPLTLVRCPEGWEKECFYHKHLGETAPEALRSIPIAEKEGRKLYGVIDDVAGLIALVQIGTLEIHVWGCREDKLEKPDMMVFDLDPSPEVPWEKTARAAFLLRDRLLELGLESFLKTTGGKGLHVTVPLTPRLEWNEIKEFSRKVAESIVRESPHEYLATMSKEKRKGKIFIDYLRNGRGATSIAAYSTRARRGAPVSTPLGWDELLQDVRSDSHTIQNIRNRLFSLKKDPWEGYFSIRQSITAKMRKKMGMDGGGKSPAK